MNMEEKIEVYQTILDKIQDNLPLTQSELNTKDTDPDFLNYQKEINTISHAVKKSAMHKKLGEIKELENSFSTASANTKKPTGRRKWLLLFGLLILGGVAYLFLELNKGGSYDKDLLLADHVVDYPDVDAVRSAELDSDIKAYNLYKDGKWRQAIDAFEDLQRTDQNPKHKFYLAVCLLKTYQYQAAQNILESKSLKEYKEVPLNYFLALTKIGTDDPDEAVELLSNPTINSPLLDKRRKKIIRIITR